MDAYVNTIAAAKEFVDFIGVPFLVTKDGGLVGLFPLGHVGWALPLWLKMGAINKTLQGKPAMTKKEVWVEGSVDARARRALEEDGWAVREKLSGELRTY